MITNERQYRISRRWLERFTQAQAGVAEQTGALHPRARQALHDQYESQLAELRADLADYESLRRGEVTVLELDSLDALPEALIRARTASGLSQEDLAGRLGLKKQQVQRYEATRYAGASLVRIQAVVEALGLTIREQVRFPATSGERGAAQEEPVSA
jgi:ribosome-binding protein aMBF1 (putative translation factor)